MVQLQEGGKPLLITLARAALVYWRIIYGSVKVETPPSRKHAVCFHGVSPSSLLTGVLQERRWWQTSRRP